MIKKIAFIGITGNLAPFAYKEILAKGIEIKAMVRNIEKLQTIPDFPREIQVQKGDLSDLESLRELFTGVDAVYLNLSTENPNAPFQPEDDGVNNVIQIAKEKGIKRIFHVSAMSVAYPEFTQGATNFVNETRKTGYRLLKESGIPSTFFHCSWIMDTIEFTMRKDNTLQGFKPAPNPFYWLAGKDLGRMVANAAVSSDHELTKDYVMQGKEPLTFEEALTRYANTYKPKLKVQMAPSWLLKFIGLFNKDARFAGQMADFFKNYREKFRAEQTWKELGEPRYTIENFWNGKT